MVDGWLVVGGWRWVAVGVWSIKFENLVAYFMTRSVRCSVSDIVLALI